MTCYKKSLPFKIEPNVAGAPMPRPHPIHKKPGFTVVELAAMSTCKREAFTLVELLVVIGIIAVLIGILLPALSSARRSAQTVKCLSNLRNLAYSFQMYAGANRNAFPVVRQDLPEINGVPMNKKPEDGGQNLWWVDFLLPYAARNVPTLNSDKLTGYNTWTRQQADNYRASVLWCPVWAADHPEIDPFDPDKFGTDRFRTGYSMNLWPSFRPNYPSPDALPPTGQINGRSGAAPGVGRYYKKAEWTDPANRLLAADSNFWYIWINITDSAGLLSPQLVSYAVAPGGVNGPGYMSIDRYRHGKYPAIEGAVFSPKGGQVKYNIMFVDGHAVTSTSTADAYKAIRMKYP
jgi:prepilin-type N-terminal cleavage/methylation domain-containing protein/prepilin-type processing-associated H-X9-DG protein